MKVIKERTIKIQYVVPENDKEKQEIEKIITDVSNEKIDIQSFKKANAGEEAKD